MKVGWKKLLASIAMPFAAGAVGSYFTFSQIASWYATLSKPFFSPPNWLFAPVWTILYLLIGISFYIFWTSKYKKKKLGYCAFSAQIALNALWSFAFFGAQSPLLGLAVIVPLWASILLMILEFRKADRCAGNLLVPYLLWVSFATLLNAAIFILN